MESVRPFGTIALSFSGGGSRAAAFHLGTLAYLARVGLLQDVSILSTVSGGSFVGATYALALAKAPAGATVGETFAAYYDRFYALLRDATLLTWAFDNLASGRIRTPSGRQNLITALAQAYDDHLTDGERFDVLWRQDTHLKEIVFNATEFHSGLAFRFWRSQKKARSGSPSVSIPEEHARRLRLADIVAASSCIPVGCEPLVFPDDFRPPDDAPEVWNSIRAEMKATGRVTAVPIMDGGVYDNQGMESVLVAIGRGPNEALAIPGGTRGFSARRHARAEHERLKEYGKLGLFIASDTPLQCENLYSVPSPPATGGITLQAVSVTAWVLLVGCLASMASIAVDAAIDEDFGAINDWLAYGIPFALAASLAIALAAARRFLRRALAQTPQVGAGTWQHVRRLRLRQVADMLGLRTSSTWALTAGVYFNRIRLLGYSVVELVPQLKARMIRHEIYDVITQDDAAKLPAWLEPSAHVVDVARRSYELQTKLWFDKTEELEDAVACGQFTMCYNLLAHIEMRGGRERSPALEAIVATSRADWELLREDPHALIKAPLTAERAQSV
ncbi:MAG: patatin-like phospholipase family protein [Acidobacteria bacterium]|nr:patatin-like phospholipase family protein [Acidobacteriota bacterium]